MANRRTQKSRNQKVKEDSEFDSQFFPLSQESPPSSNAQAEQHQRRLREALAALGRKEKAEREKRAKKERKILQEIVKHLNHELTDANNITEETMEAVEAEFNAFLTEYSTQEDKIYNLWTQIQNEQTKFENIVKEKFRHKTKAVASTASTHITALSDVNSACNESQKIMHGLIPPSDSDSDSDSDLNMTDGDS